MMRRRRAVLGASALGVLLAAAGPAGVHAQPVPPAPETVAIPLTERTPLGATRDLRAP
jgi:hypothetical protein